MRNRRVQDPHWTTAKFRSKCNRCERTINAGERIFYYPNQRTVLCSDQGCGVTASAEFNAARQDEEFYNGG